MFKIILCLFVLSLANANIYKVYPNVPASTFYKSLVPVLVEPLAKTDYDHNYGVAYGPHYGYDRSYDGDHYSHPKYQFKYGVNDPHTGDQKAQAEERDGDEVRGYYTLVEPDGTIRTVHYVADDRNGFNAVVEKSGQTKHPVVVEKVLIPIYEKPADEYSHGWK